MVKQTFTTRFPFVFCRFSFISLFMSALELSGEVNISFSYMWKNYLYKLNDPIRLYIMLYIMHTQNSYFFCIPGAFKFKPKIKIKFINISPSKEISVYWYIHVKTTIYLSEIGQVILCDAGKRKIFAADFMFVAF